jgi:hypothetical protein
MQEFSDMVNNREPLVNDVIGFMDALSFKSECADERITQNAFFVVMIVIQNHWNVLV